MRPDSDIDALELAKLASEASIRALAERERALRDLRLHAGTLLAAASLVVTFLGGQAIELNGFGWLAWMATGAFIISLVAALYVLKPAARATIGHRRAMGLRQAVAEAVDLAGAHRGYAFSIDEIRHATEPAVRRRRTGYEFASWSLVAQTLAWLVHLAS